MPVVDKGEMSTSRCYIEACDCITFVLLWSGNDLRLLRFYEQLCLRQKWERMDHAVLDYHNGGKGESGNGLRVILKNA